MDLATILLWVSALVFLGVGVQGLFMPRRILEPLGGKLDTPSVANEVRANYGGMHTGLAVLMVVGALREPYRMSAVALMFTFTLGLCVGRAVSWVLDGRPNRYLRFFYGLEAAGAAAAGFVLFR